METKKTDNHATDPGVTSTQGLESGKGEAMKLNSTNLILDKIKGAIKNITVDELLRGLINDTDFDEVLCCLLLVGKEYEDRQKINRSVIFQLLRMNGEMPVSHQSDKEDESLHIYLTRFAKQKTNGMIFMTADERKNLSSDIILDPDGLDE